MNSPSHQSGRAAQAGAVPVIGGAREAANGTIRLIYGKYYKVLYQ